MDSVITGSSVTFFPSQFANLRYSFGTTKFFNHPSIATENGYDNFWGGLSLPSLKQIMTFYPHTVDNAFAGFVVYPPTQQSEPNGKRKDLALIYAKRSSFIKGHEDFLYVVSEQFEIHSTVADWAKNNNGTAHKVILNSAKYGPFSVMNHGMLEPEKYAQFLPQFKIMIGVGFPYE